MTISKPSVGEYIFLMLIGVSVVPVVDLSINFGQAPAVSFIFTFIYIFLLLIAVGRGRLFISNGILFKALLMWVIVMLVRGFEFGYDYFRGLVISPYLFMPFTLPFIVRLFDVRDLRKCITYIHGLNLLFIAFFLYKLSFIVSRGEGVVAYLETITHNLAFPNFLLMFYFFRLTSFQKIISFSVYAIGLLVSIYFARRSLSWTYVCAGVISVLLGLYQIRTYLRSSPFTLMFSMLAVAITIGFLVQSGQDFYGGLLDRMNEDSRGTIVYDFKKDMTSSDLTFGKGIGGSYYLWTTYMPDLEGDYRNIIESGYFNLILYGGYIIVLLLAIIYLKAIYNGFFKSDNMLAKAFAALMVLHVLELYPAGVLFFNLYFLIIWVGVCMCYDRKFLAMRDGDLLALR